MPRIYDTTGCRKHKRPDGWGSLCPDDVNQETAQELLEAAVQVDDAMYNVDGEMAYRAFEHRPGLWHGHPIPWSRLPNAARKALIARGHLDDATWRKAIRKSWGAEPGR